MNSNYNLPINIGNPNEITIKTLAEKILDLVETNSKIIYQDLPKDDPTNRKPDITKAKEILKWSPKIDLDIGLIKTIDYFKTIC